jgi:hypothetical protein
VFTALLWHSVHSRVQKAVMTLLAFAFSGVVERKY